MRRVESGSGNARKELIFLVVLIIGFFIFLNILYNKSQKEFQAELKRFEQEQLAKYTRDQIAELNKLKRQYSRQQTINSKLDTLIEERDLHLSKQSSNIEQIKASLDVREKVIDEVKDYENLKGLKDFLGKPVEIPLQPLSPLEYSLTDSYKRNAVKNAFKHAWGSYRKYAWGFDELRPISKRGDNTFGNIGATIIDSLDTLWIMELYDEFNEARDWIRSSLSFERNYDSSVFETTIRILGGLLSAYDLSGDKLFLEKAEDIGKRLLNSFVDNKSLPTPRVNLLHGKASFYSWTSNIILSEVGTLQMEFLALSYFTRNSSYAVKPMEVFKYLDSMNKEEKGLYNLYLDYYSKSFKSKEMSWGGLGDSFYEYMLKLWLFTDRSFDGYRRMYEESIEGMKNKLLLTTPSGYRYIAQINNRGNMEYRMEHLTCFAGGLMGLAADKAATLKIKEDAKIAEDVTLSCGKSYDVTATQIGPEFFQFMENRDFVPGARHYLLRPETIESYFIMWRTTHEEKYRDWAWKTFLAIEKHCRTEGGYAGLQNVDSNAPGNNDDLQQSFFLAETLKYLYLIFSDDDVISIDEFVFNTEAHPIKILKNIPSVLPDILPHLIQY